MKIDLTVITGGPDVRQQNLVSKIFWATSCGLRPPGQQVVRATKGSRTEALAGNSIHDLKKRHLR